MDYSYNHNFSVILTIETKHVYHVAVCSPACEPGYTCIAPNVCRRGVQLMLGGVNYPNNSVIQFDSIYYTPDHCHSLLCTTDRVPCCSDSQGGNWYHVGSSESFINLVSTATTADYYQSRENDGTLRLIRRNDTVQSTESVIYCCQLSDASLFIHNLCVTIGIHCNNHHIVMPCTLFTQLSVRLVCGCHWGVCFIPTTVQ